MQQQHVLVVDLLLDPAHLLLVALETSLGGGEVRWEVDRHQFSL